MSTSSIKYRLLTWKDLEEIIPLIVAFCEETDAEKSAVYIMKGIVDGNTFCIVATSGSKIVGIAGWEVSSDLAVSAILYVLPEFRGGIIGGKLIRRAMIFGTSVQGIKKVIFTVTEDKLDMYTKLGFRKSPLIILEKEV